MTYDDLVKGIHRQSTMILDNIGIRVKLEDCPSWKFYRAWRELYWGKGWFSRLWCQYLRRWLFPAHHRMIEENFEQMQLQIQRELLNHTLAKGEELLRETDNALD